MCWRVICDDVTLWRLEAHTSCSGRVYPSMPRGECMYPSMPRGWCIPVCPAVGVSQHAPRWVFPSMPRGGCFPACPAASACIPACPVVCVSQHAPRRVHVSQHAPRLVYPSMPRGGCIPACPAVGARCDHQVLFVTRIINKILSVLQLTLTSDGKRALTSTSDGGDGGNGH